MTRCFASGFQRKTIDDFFARYVLIFVSLPVDVNIPSTLIRQLTSLQLTGGTWTHPRNDSAMSPIVDTWLEESIDDLYPRIGLLPYPEKRGMGNFRFGNTFSCVLFKIRTVGYTWYNLKVASVIDRIYYRTRGRLSNFKRRRNFFDFEKSFFSFF